MRYCIMHKERDRKIRSYALHRPVPRQLVFIGRHHHPHLARAWKRCKFLGLLCLYVIACNVWGDSVYRIFYTHAET